MLRNKGINFGSGDLFKTKEHPLLKLPFFPRKGRLLTVIFTQLQGTPAEQKIFCILFFWVIVLSESLICEFDLHEKSFFFNLEKINVHVQGQGN